jgi:hypothetical protein
MTTFTQPWPWAYRRQMATCDLCGYTVDDDAPPLTWTTSVEHGRRKTFCDRCSREHLRAMEGKLDSQHW